MKEEKIFSTDNSDIVQLLNFNRLICNLDQVASLLNWDQEVMMPKAATEARASQLKAIASIRHKKMTDVDVYCLLTKLENEIERNNDFTVYDRALIRETRRHYNQAIKVPARIIEELAEATAIGVEYWREARQKADFNFFKKRLARIIELKIQEADCFGYEGSRYNALLDQYEPGCKVEDIEKIFAALKNELNDIIRVYACEKNDDSFLEWESWPEKSSQIVKVEKWSRSALKEIGFDFKKGRLDISSHPFTSSFGSTDVRMTTRYAEKLWINSFFSAVHEAGHGLYEQGIDQRLANTFLDCGTSLGFHESQSRFWENIIARNASFWKSHYNDLFPACQSIVMVQYLRNTLE